MNRVSDTTVAERRRVNQRAWDIRTPTHLRSSFYDVAAARAGRSSLHPPEVAIAGDVAGQRLLHLQCHFGMDTLSWARAGAVATGVDLSGASIDAARELADELDIAARFVRADVQSLPASLSDSFDIAVTTYGVVCWLDDLDSWAAGLRRALVVGGRLVLLEFHPILEVAWTGSVSGRGRYFGCADPPLESSSGTYADRSADITYEEYRWQHPISAVVRSLLGAGFTLCGFEEYDYCSFPLLDELNMCDDGRWRPSGGAVYPYMYSIEASAPGGGRR